MAGTNYVTQGQSVLDRLMKQPTPAMYSPGGDALSEGYRESTESGLSNIASSGLTETGAVPTMFTNAGAAYQKGVTQNVAQGQLAQNQQRLQLLQSLLGLGSNAMQQARAGALSGLFTQEAGANVLEGAFGQDQGLLSSGIRDLLSRLGIV